MICMQSMSKIMFCELLQNSYRPILWLYHGQLWLTSVRLEPLINGTPPLVSNSEMFSSIMTLLVPFFHCSILFQIWAYVALGLNLAFMSCLLLTHVIMFWGCFNDWPFKIIFWLIYWTEKTWVNQSSISDRISEVFSNGTKPQMRRHRPIKNSEPVYRDWAR
jgi:hypothetical protein